MVKLSSARLRAAVGGLALSLAAGSGIASADPDPGPLINTTCTYSQAMAALNAQSPDVAGQLASSPVAQSWLRSFLASPVDQRQRMIQSVQSLPGAAQYTGVVLAVANTCNNY
jgi:hemophore-related protein